MVNDAVSEFRSENFSHYRFVYDKGNAWQWLKTPLVYRRCQFVQMGLVIDFKAQLTICISFVFSCIQVGEMELLQDVFKGFHDQL
jgi:hypothetical protein